VSPQFPVMYQPCLRGSADRSSKGACKGVVAFSVAKRVFESPSLRLAYDVGERSLKTPLFWLPKIPDTRKCVAGKGNAFTGVEPIMTA